MLNANNATVRMREGEIETDRSEKSKPEKMLTMKKPASE